MPLTNNSIHSIGRKLIARKVGSISDKGVTTVKRRGAAEIGAVVGVYALRRDISRDEGGGWRRGANAEDGDCPCDGERGEERKNAHVDEQVSAELQHDGFSLPPSFCLCEKEASRVRRGMCSLLAKRGRKSCARK